jgi:RNA polymerase sigma-70 factor (ECF subfamily)
MLQRETALKGAVGDTTWVPDSQGPAREAFEAELLPELDTLYRLALRLTVDRSRAEDLVQDTVLKAFRAWPRFKLGTNLRGWLCTILRNTFIDGYRRRAAIRMDLEGDGRRAALHEVGETDPEGAFFSRIMDGKVLEAIDALPEESREVLVLSDVENLSYAEIAKVAGAPIGTVKSRLFRARRHLKESLYEHAVAMGYIRPRPAVATPA